MVAQGQLKYSDMVIGENILATVGGALLPMTFHINAPEGTQFELTNNNGVITLLEIGKNEIYNVDVWTMFIALRLTRKIETKKD